VRPEWRGPNGRYEAGRRARFLVADSAVAFVRLDEVRLQCHMCLELLDERFCIVAKERQLAVVLSERDREGGGMFHE
jgi:hypothetical protein